MKFSENTEQEPQSHFLFPAAIFINPEPYVVDTILGSCVAVCLYDKEKKIGGINHFMLPFWNGTGLASPKYGNIAIEKLLSKMISLGCDINNIEAKIFGGGEVVDTKTNHFKIGKRNIEVAIKLLNENNIKITGKSVGGNLGRKIRFNTSTGKVLMKYIKKSNGNIGE